MSAEAKKLELSLEFEAVEYSQVLALKITGFSRDGEVRGKIFPVYATKAHIGGVEVKLHSFLTSTLHGSERLNLRAGRLAPGKNPGTCAWSSASAAPGNEFFRLVSYCAA